MLTLEEIMQPHVFAKSEPVDPPLPSSISFGPTSTINRGGMQDLDVSFPNIPSGPSSFPTYPNFPVSNIISWCMSLSSCTDATICLRQSETQHSWYGPASQVDIRGENPSFLNAKAEQKLIVACFEILISCTGNTYAGYNPGPHHQGINGTDANGLRRPGSPSLQHAQDIMAFSERVAMPPMPEPAPGSLSPSSLSPDFKRREFSPNRPQSKDGLLSQRSDTSHDNAPQKRSGKLPASGKFII